MSNILDLSTYQSFDFLGDKLKASNTIEKYNKSKIEDIDLNNKKCLDIGCNAGYFCFRMLKNGASSVVGIDASQQFINVANDINKEYFKNTNVSFKCVNFFDYETEDKFDFIICFSTFHYFFDKQELFIKKSHKLLNDNGIILVEVEEHPSDEDKIFKCVRPADMNSGALWCYPTRSKMYSMVSPYFNILHTPYESVFQPGSLYKRSFYHMKKS
jgi:SAM-dependent methyltransferase